MAFTPMGSLFAYLHYTKKWWLRDKIFYELTMKYELGILWS